MTAADIQAMASNTISNSSTSTITAINWMEGVNDTALVSEISIPGTHDSGARIESFSGTAKCQNLSIQEQLNIGIRFLDIRCRHYYNSFAIHHGSVYQKINFDDVLNACFNFLGSNPSETIIMCIKEEHNPSDNTRSFEDTFMSYYQKNPGGWRLGSSIPTLGEVRGKIVLMRRFGANTLPKGIPAVNWGDNTTFSSGNLRVQDCYKVSNNDSKWDSITSLFGETLSGLPETLYINYTSGYKPGLFGIPSIPKVSDVINPKVVDFFRTRGNGRYGIIPMDFADTYKSGLIIKTNIAGSITGVTFFRDIDYSGVSGQTLGKGRYTMSQLQAAGVPNDWASSCEIPIGWKVTVYENENFSGKTWTLYADPNGGQSNFVNYSGLNDAMTSCVIE